MNIVEEIEAAQRRDVPQFKAGDSVKVHFRVIEGNRQRVQVFEGVCIKRHGHGTRDGFAGQGHIQNQRIEVTLGARESPALFNQVLGQGGAMLQKHGFLRYQFCCWPCMVCNCSTLTPSKLGNTRKAPEKS